MAPTGQASKANEQQEKQQPTFKEQLDQAAYDARHPEGKDEKPSVIGKGIEKGKGKSNYFPYGYIALGLFRG